MQILPNLWFVRLANPPKNLFDYSFVVVDVVFVRVGVFPFHVPNGTNITSRLKLLFPALPKNFLCLEAKNPVSR